MLARTIELGCHRERRRRARAALDLLQQQVEALAPDLEEVLAHRRERRREERGLGHVVEARPRRRRPGPTGRASCSARSRPRAIWSLATKTAVTSGSAARRACRARSPDAGLQSPESARRRLDSRRAQRLLPADDALTRLEPVRPGPRCARRCGGRARADAGSPRSRRPPDRRRQAERRSPDRASTATIGRSSGSWSTACAASVCGAITRIPSTPWTRSRSTASSTTPGRASAGSRCEMKYPASCAAWWMPKSVVAGP